MNHNFPKIETPAARPKEEQRRPVDYILGSAKKRPDPLEFVDNSRPGYTEAEVRKDIEYVERLKSKFAEGSGRAEALEIITIEYGEEFQWFGKESGLDRTSLYDDYKGVDGIWYFKIKDFPFRIALAIDTSMRSKLSEKQRIENESRGAAKIKTIKDKIENNIAKINNPQISTVKYYHSGDGKEVDQTLIVPVVIGLEGENADELIKLFGKIAELRQKEKTLGLDEPETSELSRLKEEAKNHPAQVIFLKQTLLQLSEYSEKLKNEKGFKSFYRDAVAGLENMVSKVLKEKEHISTKPLEGDEVFRKIKETIKKEEKKD